MGRSICPVPGDNAAARDLGDEDLVPSHLAPTSVCPRWHFASTIGADRHAAITDLDHIYSGWSVEIAHEGTSTSVRCCRKTCGATMNQTSASNPSPPNPTR
jgi:hypothetical protein